VATPERLFRKKLSNASLSFAVALGFKTNPVAGESRRFPFIPLAEKPIIIGMTTDPEPQQSVINFNAQSTVMKTHASRPESPNLLEL
jgi:hypothetical protein